MEILVELESVEGMEDLARRVREAVEVADWIDVPDSPAGRPGPFSPLLCSMIKSLWGGVKVISHLRTRDVNMLAFKSIVKTLRVAGVERLLLTRGDVPRGSVSVDEVDPEEGVSIARKYYEGLELGLTLSLRKGLEDIEKRVRKGADFYLALNLSESTLGRLEGASSLVHEQGAKLYPYIILSTPKNRGVLERVLRGTRIYRREEALAMVKRTCMQVDGILVSAPLDYESLIKFAREARHLC